MKARGEGLSLPLQQFDVFLAPGEPAALLHTLWAPNEAAEWSLRDVTQVQATSPPSLSVDTHAS